MEFDCVFVPSLNDIEYSDQGFLYSMDLYVVFHRARDQLFLGSNLKADEIKNNKILIPDILHKPMKVRDYKGNSLQIGFDNKVHFREFVTVEDGIVNINTTQTNNDQKSKKQKVPLDENSKHNQNELSEKNVLTPKKKLDELRNKKDSKFKDKGKNLNKIEDVLEFIQRLPFSEANAKKLEKKMESLSFGDKNIIRMKWQNLLKPKKKKIVKKDDPSIKTNITKVNKNESPRLEISIVSGNKGDMYLIRSLIKEYLIDKNQNNIQVISLKKSKNRVFKTFHRFLSQNLDGIANYIIPDQNKTQIMFQSNTRKKLIKVLDQESDICWKSKIIILGLEDLRKDDFINKGIEELMIGISLKPEQLVNIIHPNTADETPGVSYMNNKNDDGSLETKYYEF